MHEIVACTQNSIGKDNRMNASVIYTTRSVGNFSVSQEYSYIIYVR